MPLCRPVQGSYKQYCTAMATRIGAAKVQGFRKGDLIDRRRKDSPIYSLYIRAEVNSAPLSAIPEN